MIGKVVEDLKRNKLINALFVGVSALIVCASSVPAYACGAYVAGEVIQVTDPEEYKFANAEINADYIEIVQGPEAPEKVEEAVEEPEESEKTELNPYQELAARTSEEDWRLLEWIVALEANTEKMSGKRAVVEVIFNRCLSSKWDAPWGGDTIGEVIRAKKQFSTLKVVGSPKAWATPGQAESDAIAETIAAGPSILPSMDYTYFSRGKSNGSGFVKVYDGSHHWFSHH